MTVKEKKNSSFWYTCAASYGQNLDWKSIMQKIQKLNKNQNNISPNFDDVYRVSLQYISHTVFEIEIDISFKPDISNADVSNIYYLCPVIIITSTSKFLTLNVKTIMEQR